MRSDVRARFMRPLQRSRPVARQRSSTRSVTDLGRQQTNVALRRQLREERGTGATGRRSRTLGSMPGCQGGSRRTQKETRASYREPLPSTRRATGLRRQSFSQRPPRTLASKMNRRQTRRPCPLRLPRSSSCLGPAPSPARTPRASLSSRRGSRSGELRMSAPLSRRMWRC
jgi:hypothetical protein